MRVRQPPPPLTLRRRRHTVAAAPAVTRVGHIVTWRFPAISVAWSTTRLVALMVFVRAASSSLYRRLQSTVARNRTNCYDITLFLKVRKISVSLCVQFNKSCYKIWSRKTAPFLVYSLIFIVTLWNNPEGRFSSFVSKKLSSEQYFSALGPRSPPPITATMLDCSSISSKLKWWVVTPHFSVSF